MAIHPGAGKRVPVEALIDVADLVTRYYEQQPDPGDPGQQVSFGTSGHRGASHQGSFNELHIAAISQAICEYRDRQGISGPLFLGKDTHALSTPAEITALRVFAARGVRVMIDRDGGYTPTPVISHAILCHNRDKGAALADGVVITPSHNPPDNGGFKYNSPNGGPADTDATGWIATRANELLLRGPGAVEMLTREEALAAESTIRHDYIGPYVEQLDQVVDMRAIADSGISICADAMGGSGLRYWQAIAERYDLNMTVRNDQVDHRFSFMSLDRDGKVRMDCSSPYAMAGLIELREEFDIAFGNDPDYDRHGIVTRSAGLLNPNHYLSVAIQYLFSHRGDWPVSAAVGKTLVSSSMIDRVAQGLGRELKEVPVGLSGLSPVCWMAPMASAGKSPPGHLFCAAMAGYGVRTRTVLFYACLPARSLPSLAGIPVSTTGTWKKSTGVLSMLDSRLPRIARRKPGCPDFPQNKCLPKPSPEKKLLPA